MNVWMVTLCFGKLTNSYREVQRLSKIVEVVLLLEVVFLDHLPIATQLGAIGRQFITRQRRHPTPAWHTLL